MKLFPELSVLKGDKEDSFSDRLRNEKHLGDEFIAKMAMRIV
jgi:hypothetical protein